MLEVVEVDLVPGLVVGGKWRLERLVGKGGFGVVWAAVDLTNGEPRALKCLTEEGAADAKRQERLRREARAMSAIVHPNIAHVFGLEELPAGTPFIVMELLQGRTLHAHLRRGPLSLPQARGILIQISDALRTSHARGIIHRDLKPANVVIIDDRIVKVLDFGIAKDLSSSERHKLTTTGTTLGTLYYMAPEQIFGERNLDPRADVWALGVLAHECLTLRRPMDADGDNSGQVLKKILDGNFPRLASMVRDCPRDIDDLVARMLTRDVAARPTAEEIYTTLSRPADAATRPRSLAKTNPMDGTLPLSDAPLFAQTLHEERFAASQFVPSTMVPSTNVPATVVPSTNVPSTVVPSTNVPSTVVPSTIVAVATGRAQAPGMYHAATQASAQRALPPPGAGATLPSHERNSHDSGRYAPAITPVHARPADEPTFDIRAHRPPMRSPALAIALAAFGGVVAIGAAIYVVGTTRARREDTSTNEAASPAAPSSIASPAAASAALPATSAAASASASASASAQPVPPASAATAGAAAHAPVPSAHRAAASPSAPGGRTSPRPTSATAGDPPITDDRF